jgi:hypothetical protein
MQKVVYGLFSKKQLIFSQRDSMLFKGIDLYYMVGGFGGKLRYLKLDGGHCRS